jgi:hypothetical protein
VHKPVFSALLYDPYNVPLLYNEIARILKPGGLFLGTLPHIEWGTALRRNPNELHRANFVTDNGGRFSAASHLMHPEEIAKCLRASGLIPKALDTICLPRDTQPVSPDISAPARTEGKAFWELPIIQLVIAQGECEQMTPLMRTLTEFISVTAIGVIPSLPVSSALVLAGCADTCVSGIEGLRTSQLDQRASEIS